MSVLGVEDVSKRYERQGGRRVALDRVSLELQRGELAGLYGPSGAGKSTLLRIAAGLLPPDEGVVRYNGERLDRMSAGERQRLRRREISCVWSAQQGESRLTALDHVAVALLVDGCGHRRALRAAGEALLACEVEQCAQTELCELSGGERQHVEIARAIVTEPKLLLADSPTSTLSLIEQERVMALLACLARDARVAVLVADSDAETLLGCTTLLCLSAGRLIDSTAATEGARVYRLPARARDAAADG
ncbi:MAG: ABC transporter ATP-binding protein [Solirubrobacteraceae bacterium]